MEEKEDSQTMNPPHLPLLYLPLTRSHLARVAVEVLEQSYLNSGVVSSLALFSSDLSLNDYYASLH